MRLQLAPTVGNAKQEVTEAVRRAWVHPLPSDPPICKALAIPKHPTGPSEFSTNTSNPMNLTPEDQFLLWRQELEARQEDQAKQVAELREQANRLREENERL